MAEPTPTPISTPSSSNNTLNRRKRQKRKSKPWWRPEVVLPTTKRGGEHRQAHHDGAWWRPMVPLFGVSLVLFIIYSYVSSLRSLVRPRWCSSTTTTSTTCWTVIGHDAIVTYLGIMVLFHYFSTIYRSPGVVLKQDIAANHHHRHPHWNPWKGQGGIAGGWWRAKCSPDDERKLVALYSDSAAWTFCKKCQHHRPPRCHHCSVCQRCILQFDHHCIWVNQCIGYNNYRSFVLFLFYTTLSCVYGCAMLVGPMWESLVAEVQQSGPVAFLVRHAFLAPIVAFNGRRPPATTTTTQASPSATLVQILVPVLFSIAVALLVLLISHIDLVCTARTSLEENFYHHRNRKSPYDQHSWRHNVQQIMGQWWWCCLPVPFEPPPPYLPQDG